MAVDQYVKERPQSREMQLSRGRATRMLIEIESDESRLDLHQRDTAGLRPGQEFPNGMAVCCPRVRITNLPFEEFVPGKTGLRARLGDHRRQGG